MGLIITLLLGLFTVVGAVITFVSKNNKKFVNFSISLAFSVMVMLIFVDLIPEIKEYFFAESGSFRGKVIAIGMVVLGFVLLKLLDKFIPDHDSSEKRELKHIGLISSIALILHNIIEGVAIYWTVNTSLETGILMCLGIGLHNIPLGMVLCSIFYKSNNDKKKTCLAIGVISISTFLGGFIGAFLSDIFTNPVVLGILICITTGMLIYISIYELLPKIFEMKNKKIAISGIFFGIILILLTMFI